MSEMRTIRSAGWYDVADYCRSANRYCHLPVNRFEFLGLRIAKHRNRSQTIRGNGWGSFLRNNRPSSRFQNEPENHYDDDGGFRTARKKP